VGQLEYPSGREGNWCITGLSPRKRALIDILLNHAGLYEARRRARLNT
jgi:hypothetical protein